jgi:hypothetical protein
VKVFNIKINEDVFQVKAKEIFTASKRALDLFHERRKQTVGKMRLIPKHIEMMVTVSEIQSLSAGIIE